MKIGKDWLLRNDSLNIILAKRKQRIRKGTNEKYEDWEDVGYFATVPNALKYLVAQHIRDADLKGLKTISEQISEVEQMIEMALKVSTSPVEAPKR